MNGFAGGEQAIIIGAKRVDQLEDNLAAVDVALSAEEIKTLDEVSELPKEYPGWMVAWQGSNRMENVERTRPASAAEEK